MGLYYANLYLVAHLVKDFLICRVTRPREPHSQLCAAISSKLQQELRKSVECEFVAGLGCFSFQFLVQILYVAHGCVLLTEYIKQQFVRNIFARTGQGYVCLLFFTCSQIPGQVTFDSSRKICAILRHVCIRSSDMVSYRHQDHFWMFFGQPLGENILEKYTKTEI